MAAGWTTPRKHPHKSGFYFSLPVSFLLGETDCKAWNSGSHLGSRGSPGTGRYSQWRKTRKKRPDNMEANTKSKEPTFGLGQESAINFYLL